MAVVLEDATRIAQTERGTPVYLLEEEVPLDVLPACFRKRRIIRTPPPCGPFSEWLVERFGTQVCVLVRVGVASRIFKIGKNGDVFPITARSLPVAERKRLHEAGLLKL